jgi:hypothetical protein
MSQNIFSLSLVLWGNTLECLSLASFVVLSVASSGRRLTMQGNVVRSLCFILKCKTRKEKAFGEKCHYAECRGAK